MATLENWRVTKWKMRRYVLSWGWVGRGAFKECKLIWCGHVGFTGSNYHGEKKVLVPTVGHGWRKPTARLAGATVSKSSKHYTIICLFIYFKENPRIIDWWYDMWGANTWASELIDLTILLHFHWWRFDEIIVYITWKPLESFVFFWLYFLDCCFFCNNLFSKFPKHTYKKNEEHILIPKCELQNLAINRWKWLA